MLIFCDVDGVVADLVPAWLARYNKDYDDNKTNDDLKAWDIVRVVKPECGAKIFDYIEDPTLYDEVKPIPGALMGIEELRDMGHRVVFCTSTPNGSAGRKLLWLLDNGFLHREDMKGTVHPDYIEVHDKSLLRGDILIDDAPHYVDAFQGLSILMRQPHNEWFEWGIVAADFAQVLRIIEDTDNLPIGNHPVEIRCPHQTKAFKTVLDDMYRVHLDKNMDYSPANILGTGFVGLTTRLWDKCARLLNLTGFRMTVAKSEFVAPQDPKNESVDDTLIDMANYAVIGKLLRQGDWGR